MPQLVYRKPINSIQNITEETPFYTILETLERRVSLSENEVIRRLEIPRSTYRSWKDGTSEPSRRVYWRKLSKVFGAQLDQLIFGSETTSKK